MKNYLSKSHSPVLVNEILSVFSKSPDPCFLLDCTFGRGGHSLAFLKKFPKLKVLALDWDEEAIIYGRQKFLPLFKDRLQPLQNNFHNLLQIPSLTDSSFDSILMDLGVSSTQLDQGERGFSFYHKGPLDMRMDRRQTLKASDIVNDSSKEELINFFKEYGEIINPHSVVNSLIRERKKRRIERVEEMVKIILKHIPWNRNKTHPATAYFLALRMKVNNELEGLKKSLPASLHLLKPGGKLMVISFHSLEDRIVKQAFKGFVQKNQGDLWNKKIIRPSLEEKKINPRSRSAKLRVFEKNSDFY